MNVISTIRDLSLKNRRTPSYGRPSSATVKDRHVSFRCRPARLKQPESERNNNQMNYHRTLRGTFALVLAICLTTVSLLSRADEPYQYIITPGYDPDAASLVDTSSVSSPAVAFVSGTLSTPAAEAVSLEARFRMWLESLGVALKSTRFKGICIRIR